MTVSGTDASDTLYVGAGSKTVYMGAGNDLVVAKDAAWMPGDKLTVFAGDGNDIVHGGVGNDVLVGHADIFAVEHNVLDGGAGDDVLYAGAGDEVSGGAGHDVLYVVNAHDFSLDLGASSIEYVLSDFGNDSFDAHTQTASVQIYAGGGNDRVIGSDHGDVVYAGPGNDTVLGGAGNDTIIGDTGADSLSGGGGDDTLYVDSSDTFLDGGAGHNAAYITGVPGDPGLVLDVAASHFAFVADFAGNSDNLNGAAATAALTLYAGAGNDTVAGGSGNDVIWGQAGNDHLVGNGGSDVLVGGTGADTLEGGAGVDALYFNSGGGSDGARDVAVRRHRPRLRALVARHRQRPGGDRRDRLGHRALPRRDRRDREPGRGGRRLPARERRREAEAACARALADWIGTRGGTEPAEVREAIAQVRRFFEAHGDVRFEQMDDHETKPVLNRSGWRRGYADDRLWYVLPETWRSEVCAGLDPVATARILADRGMLRRDPQGKLQRSERTPLKSAQRVYVVTAELFEGGEDAR